MPNSLQIQLQNQTNSNHVYAYITGIAIQDNGARVLLKANGHDLYYPQNPPAIGSPLAEDCAIPLGPPGNTVTVTIPQIAGGRIWFSCEGKLTFLLNPGPALVEPSVLNPSDPNANINFGFAEFTLNNDQLFANISYVDFVSRLPIALTLQTAGGGVQHVSGMHPDGLDRIADGLRAQARKDGKPWDKLIVQRDGTTLRALNPTHGNAVGANFDGYYEPFIEQVWQKYSQGSRMRINTQAGPGIVQGSINHRGELIIGGESFSKPNTADILGCNSGPFTTGPSPTRNAIIPRLAASFLRSTLLHVEDHPSDPSTHYKHDPTNHYSRIVHENNLDGKGYAFAYDDVQPDGGADQSGKVNAGDPTVFIVAVGGNNAYAGDRMSGGQTASQQQHYQQQPVNSGQRGQGRPHEERQQSHPHLRAFAQKIFR
ncbi:putative glucanase b [Phaeomoniella chlamydospora]|uniref:Putative glucanase b n=1 Tax=Phaeomoniella chlamydospora TaxID=158046 RepID=A0A0G2GEB4_PHACM|nr:putative glucanase b [Phaeomoniella chlamydospora]